MRRACASIRAEDSDMGKVNGTCHICGRKGELSFEHVPPRAAFNDRRVISATFEQTINLGPDEEVKGTIKQRGAGGYTLCPKCNNDTGTWYAKDFVGWCYQGMEILIRAKGKPSLIYMHYVLPLRVIKQIVAMFLSVNSASFGQANPELVCFVLNKEAKFLPPKYRFFVYYNIEGRWRSAGFSVMVMGNLTRSTFCSLSEISYPPFGYVMTIDSDPPDARLFEISNFARFGYNDFSVLNLKLPVLPTHLGYPGDYRTKGEIEEQRLRSMAEEARLRLKRKMPP